MFWQHIIVTTSDHTCTMYVVQIFLGIYSLIFLGMRLIFNNHNYYRGGKIPSKPPSSRADLLPYLLEAVQDRDTGNTVYLAEGVEAHRVEVLLASYLGILDDGSGRMVDYHHGMVTL